MLRAVCVWLTSLRLLLREEALDETFGYIQVLFYKSHRGLKVDLWIAEKLVKIGIVTPGDRAEFSSGQAVEDIATDRETVVIAEFFHDREAHVVGHLEYLS